MESHLSEEEIRIINNVKTGCEVLIKLISSDRLKNPKKYADLTSHTKDKPVVRIFAIHEVLRIITENKYKTFRPIDIRQKLPDVYKDIRYSALSDIIDSLKKMNL